MALKRMFTFVDEDVQNAITKLAEKEHLSASALISKILKEYLKEGDFELENTKDKNQIDNDVKRCRVWIDEETVPVLNEKAASVGLSNTAYIRNLIHTTDFKIYHVQTENIDEFINEVHKAVSSLSSTISLIKRYGKGKVFEQDVVKIQNDADEIKSLLRKIVANLYGTRRSVQQKLVTQYKKADKNEI